MTATTTTTTSTTDGAAMTHADKSRLRMAAFRVKRVYPGVAGEILAAEIFAWEEFGYRLGGGSKITRLVDEVLAAILVPPDPPPAHAARPFGGFITRSAT